MKRTFVLLALALLITACRPPSGGAAANGAGGEHTVSAAFVEKPALGASPLRVTVLKDGAPVEGARVEVTGDMTHAGMAPVVAEAEGEGGGSYLTQGFAFNMAGDWIITVDVTYPDGAEVTEHLAASVPGG